VLGLGICLVAVPTMLGSRFGVLGAAPFCVGLAGAATLATRIAPELRRAALGNALLAVSIAAFALFAVGPRLAGYRTLTVLSGSMRPTFAPGDVAVVTRESAGSLRVGDVIAYQVPVGERQVETHRVVQILRREPNPVVVTKGDANDASDPWTAELHGPVWRYRFAVPQAGQVVVALRRPLVRKTLLFALPTLLALLGLARIWGTPAALRKVDVARPR
jgi:signal peptidase